MVTISPIARLWIEHVRTFPPTLGTGNTHSASRRRPPMPRRWTKIYTRTSSRSSSRSFRGTFRPKFPPLPAHFASWPIDKPIVTNAKGADLVTALLAASLNSQGGSRSDTGALPVMCVARLEAVSQGCQAKPGQNGGPKTALARPGVLESRSRAARPRLLQHLFVGL
ncbi:hypothetical protein BC826DRAFT_481082 [Russula brevipes]|nr:hypothetical protein BC826DRAFT_481082 [Russula brevipes]